VDPQHPVLVGLKIRLEVLAGAGYGDRHLCTAQVSRLMSLAPAAARPDRLVSPMLSSTRRAHPV
jgi:hypothetical protein